MARHPFTTRRPPARLTLDRLEDRTVPTGWALYRSEAAGLLGIQDPKAEKKQP